MLYVSGRTDGLHFTRQASQPEPIRPDADDLAFEVTDDGFSYFSGSGTNLTLATGVDIGRSQTIGKNSVDSCLDVFRSLLVAKTVTQHHRR